MFILTMHPHISGHRSRIVQIDKLITYMFKNASFRGVGLLARIFELF